MEDLATLKPVPLADSRRKECPTPAAAAVADWRNTFRRRGSLGDALGIRSRSTAVVASHAAAHHPHGGRFHPGRADSFPRATGNKMRIWWVCRLPRLVPLFRLAADSPSLRARRELSRSRGRNRAKLARRLDDPGAPGGKNHPARSSLLPPLRAQSAALLEARPGSPRAHPRSKSAPESDYPEAWPETSVKNPDWRADRFHRRSLSNRREIQPTDWQNSASSLSLVALVCAGNSPPLAARRNQPGLWKPSS